MSEQKLISPLLDGFAMGNPMSDHDGVRSCPAIKENSEKKYIVKIISIPASQAQMDALLLAGAYKDPAGAMDYYKELCDDIVKEAELLKKLSRLEGFLPYEGWQIEPITRKRLGYEVYLLGSYKRSLEKHLHQNPVTALEALNLGIDLCSALNVCRQAGYLYVDLKPSNIFVSDRKEFRIGDLGFLSLDALSYSTLPNKYRSIYTPPEFDDPMAPLNTTADTYALGMILFQLYNDSQLPNRESVTSGILTSPVNADYELAEIIMKAIHPDHTQRWQDPASMGQALIGYMQRNVVNDVPITPYTPLELPQEPQAKSEEAKKEVSPGEAAPESPEDQTLPEESPEAVPEAPREEAAGGSVPAAEADETSPSEEDADLLQPHEMSEELSKIVAKADDLIAHETPEGVVIPEAPELPDPFAFAMEDFSEAEDDLSIPLDPVMEEPAEEEPAKQKKNRKRFLSPESKGRMKRFFRRLLTLVILAALAFAGYYYYQNFFLQPIDALMVEGTGTELTVTVDTQLDKDLLSVICSDPYGHVWTQPLTEGKATFDQLMTDTDYTIELDVKGFYKLTGETTSVFTTDANTKILSFTAVTGPENGSLVLSFTVDGEEPDEWSVICSAEGEEDHRQTFTGHDVTVKGLTIGKVYTITLTAGDDLTLSGETQIQFIPSLLILAKDISIGTKNGTDLALSWKAPGDVVIESWDVRCYNIRGFDVQHTVSDPSVLIPGVDLSTGYTIEITAAGMTHPARFSITKDPLEITSLTMEDAQTPGLEALNLSWEYNGTAPLGGWLVLYTIDGAATPTVIKSEEPAASLSPLVPGATYHITIQAADGTSVLNSVYTYACPEAKPFDENHLSADTVTTQLLKTPEEEHWRYDTISDTAFTNVFASGDKISLVMRAENTFYLPGSETRLLYVYRDPHGNVLSDLVVQEKIYWKNIWTGGDVKAGELNVPTTPADPGEYVLELYINGQIMAKLPLTIQ